MTQLNSTQFTVRPPHLGNQEEMNALYLSGFDAWNEGRSIETFLADCRKSQKYAQGKWYVLADENDQLVSKLIVYPMGPANFGIGTFATPPKLRGKGLGSILLQGVLKSLHQEGARVIFLFSDISPEYYERFGFKRLPDGFQKAPHSVLMALGVDAEKVISSPGFTPPEYF